MSNLVVLKEFLENNNYSFKENELLKLHTSFKIGGNASLFVSPSDENELKEITDKCKELSVKFYILGNGTNVLFSDKGFDGVVISTTEKMNGIRRIDETSFECDAGVTLSAVCNYALENSLSGFECLYGIPGTVGGAIITNAGAYGGEISDVAVEVKHIDENGKFDRQHQQEGQGVGGGFATFFDKRKTPCKIGRTWGKMARFDMRNGRRKNAKTTLYLYLRITLNKKAWL